MIQTSNPNGQLLVPPEATCTYNALGMLTMTYIMYKILSVWPSVAENFLHFPEMDIARERPSCSEERL